MITRAEIGHWWRVARPFPIASEAFWVGIFHDTVEDGYLPKILLRWWPALDAMTRRDGEPYPDFIERAAADLVARRVKLSDVRDNLSRNGGPPRQSLRERYEAALVVLDGAD